MLRTPRHTAQIALCGNECSTMNEPIKTYADKLKDPRWQRRRLEILQRDNWGCIYCGDKTSELQVHHLLYLSNRDPWEYDDEHLVTACIACHADETRLKEEDKMLVNMMSMAGCRRRDLYSFFTDLRRFIRESGVPKDQFQRLMEFLHTHG